MTYRADIVVDYDGVNKPEIGLLGQADLPKRPTERFSVEVDGVNFGKVEKIAQFASLGDWYSFTQVHTRKKFQPTGSGREERRQLETKINLHFPGFKRRGKSIWTAEVDVIERPATIIDALYFANQPEAGEYLYISERAGNEMFIGRITEVFSEESKIAVNLDEETMKAASERAYENGIAHLRNLASVQGTTFL